MASEPRRDQGSGAARSAHGDAAMGSRWHNRHATTRLVTGSSRNLLWRVEDTGPSRGPTWTMHLEVAEFPVRRARLGFPAAYEGGALTIDADAVRCLVLQDPRIAEVRLELTHPGDSARVLRALDAIEPLHKPVSPVSAFPGFLGPPHTAGHGRTHRLAGLAVVQVTEFPFPASGVQAFEEGLIEMSGPGAAY